MVDNQNVGLSEVRGALPVAAGTNEGDHYFHSIFLKYNLMAPEFNLASEYNLTAPEYNLTFRHQNITLRNFRCYSKP